MTFPYNAEIYSKAFHCIIMSVNNAQVIASDHKLLKSLGASETFQVRI